MADGGDPSVLGKRKREYPCSWDGCVYIATRAEHLKTHVRTHTGEKPYMCGEPDCDKAFAQSSDLTKHKRTHSGEKPYKCDYVGCGKAFARLDDVNVHMRMHTGEKPFACDHDGCGKTFAHASGLVMHKRGHTGERPCICDHPGCGKAFVKTGDLDVHKRVHTGIKPFACAEPGCTYTATTKNGVTVHMRTHTGEKPFKCDVPDCSYAATVSSSLEVHKRSHTGEKPFGCTEEACDYRSAQQANLRTHNKRWHTAAGIQRQKKSENRLALALTAAGVGYVREHRIDTACIRVRGCRYIDFLLTHSAADDSSRGVVIAVENDEYQHDLEDADCHCKRMAEVVEALVLDGNTLPVAFLRFNPHGFARNGVPCKVLYADRMKELLAAIDGLKAHVDAGDELPPLSIRYLFYNTDADGRPCLLKDPLYAADLLPCVA